MRLLERAFRRRHVAFALFAASAWCLACSSSEPTASGGGAVPELGAPESRALVVAGTRSDGLATPRDLAFDPLMPGRLWVVNAGLTGVVIFDHLGKEDQTSQRREDVFAPHFMNNPSSLAFGTDGAFATCGESRDEWNGAAQPGDDFMGPTLWSSELNIFAHVNQARGTGREGSHIDMLHESPLCMGIEHDDANVYFAVDGLHGEIVRYDFQADHGPGGTDHSNGIVRRFPEAKITRVEGVPGHLALDHDQRILYVADTGAGRVMRLAVDTGTKSTLALDKEPLAEYSKVTETTYTSFAEGLHEPSGIALHDGKVFVAEHATGDIVAFDRDGKELGRVATGAKGLMGLAFSDEGKLYFVDAATDHVVRIDPLKQDGVTDRVEGAPYDGGAVACESIDNDGPDVTESLIPTARPNKATGTALPDGKYHLTKIETFTGTGGDVGPGALERRETYVVKNGRLVGVQRYVTDAPKDDHLVFDVAVASGKLSVRAECFEGAGALRGGAFEETADGIVIYPAYANFAWTWTRVP